MLDGDLTPLVILNSHRYMSVRMTSNLLSLRSNRTQKVWIIVDASCNNEECSMRLMLAQYIEQMIDRVIAAPIIKRKKHRIIRNGLDDAGTIRLAHLRA